MSNRSVTSVDSILAVLFFFVGILNYVGCKYSARLNRVLLLFKLMLLALCIGLKLSFCFYQIFVSCLYIYLFIYCLVQLDIYFIASALIKVLLGCLFTRVFDVVIIFNDN